jgi:hypothetical protein
MLRCEQLVFCELVLLCELLLLENVSCPLPPSRSGQLRASCLFLNVPRQIVHRAPRLPFQQLQQTMRPTLRQHAEPDHFWADCHVFLYHAFMVANTVLPETARATHSCGSLATKSSSVAGGGDGALTACAAPAGGTLAIADRCFFAPLYERSDHGRLHGLWGPTVRGGAEAKSPSTLH